MNSEDLDRELDEWLDRAAAEYSRAEIWPGFENRIIAKLKSRRESRRRRFHWIPLAAAGTAILVFSVYVLRTDFQDRGEMDIASQSPVASGSGPEQSSHRESKPEIISAKSSIKGDTGPRVHRKAIQTERGRFLSSGLSDRERYLMAFVRAVSEQSPTGISEGANFKPLKIPEAKIPEFTIPDFEISSFENESQDIPIPGKEEEL
jgi:hypothetical protein